MEAVGSQCLPSCGHAGCAPAHREQLAEWRRSAFRPLRQRNPAMIVSSRCSLGWIEWEKQVRLLSTRSRKDVTEREELTRALDHLRPDTMVVTKLDRLARSMAHLMDLIRLIDAKFAALRILHPSRSRIVSI